MATQQHVHQLGDILQRILAPSPAVREPAEAQLASYFAAVDHASDALYALALIGQGAGAYAVDIRILALVLLRRKAFSSLQDGNGGNVFDALPASGRERIERCLMSVLRDEFDGRVRRGVEDVVGRWVEGGPLPELTSTLLELAATSSPLHRISVFHLLLSNPDIFTLSSRSTTWPVGTVVQVLVGGIDDPVHEVRVEAVRAAAAVITAGEEYGKLPRAERTRVGAGLVAKICQILPAFPSAQTQPCIEALTSISESHDNSNTALFPFPVLAQLIPFLMTHCRLPLALEHTLPPLLHASAHAPSSALRDKTPAAAAATEAGDDFPAAYTRFSGALNLLITLCGHINTGLHHHPSLHAREIVPLLLAWLALGICSHPLGSEEERALVQAWVERDDTEEEDDEVTEMQEYGLEAFATILPRTDFLQTLFEYVPAMISAPDWRVRAAACEAIGAISLATKDAVVGKLGQVLQLISQLMSDPHVRVLFAVADAVGNMAEVFDSDLTSPDRQKSFEMLSYLLTHAHVDRVVEHAAQALVPLIDASEQGDVVPYLEGIVQALVGLLQNRPLYVQQQALRTLASLAITADKAFRPFYDKLMPELLNMLSTPVAKDRRMLKAVGIECAAFIGTAAGKQVFKRDAARLAGIMAEIQQSITDDDDPQSGYLTSTWSFIADALGDDFEPWMPLVMSKMLTGAQQPVQVKTYQDDTEEVATGWDVIDDQYLLNTSALEDRLTHVQQLDQICVHLGSRLIERYLDDVAKCCIENLQFKLDESVREAAAGFIPTLTKHAKATNRPEVLESVLSTLPDVILREETMSVLSTLYDKLHESIEILGPPLSLPPAFVQRLTQATHFHLSAIGEQRVMRKKLVEAGDEEGELEYERGKEEEEDEALDSIGRLLYALDSGHALLFTIGGLRELALSPE